MISKFKCAKCGSKLRTEAEEAGISSSCPKCGSAVTVPFPGLTRLGFWGCWIGAKLFGGLLGVIGSSDGSIIIMLPIFLFLGMIITYFRTINIGLHPAWTFAGLIPGSIFYFGFIPEGHAKKKPDKPDKINLAHLNEKQKSFLRAHLEGATIEWAAVQHDVKFDTAQKIYAEFCKLPKEEQDAYFVDDSRMR